jgi:hypothetical protein
MDIDLVLHRALSSSEDIVPSYILAGLNTCHSSGVAQEEQSVFPFYDLSTGLCDPSQVSLVGRALRFRRETMRTRLIQSAKDSIYWNKNLNFSMSAQEPDHVVATLRDNSHTRSSPLLVKASLIVGADGPMSPIRQRFVSKIYQRPGIPRYIMLVFTVKIPRELMAPLLTIDKNIFRGSHPGKGHYIFFLSHLHAW